MKENVLGKNKTETPDTFEIETFCALGSKTYTFKLKHFSGTKILHWKTKPALKNLLQFVTYLGCLNITLAKKRKTF